MLGALCVLAIAYRYYSAFIAAKVLALDDSRPTPAHLTPDGHNFVATNKWVLFGHHFAAISGSGPLIGPTLAAQFGFAPGFLWLLGGVTLAGAVHDFVILASSMRRGGRSLAELVREELGPIPGVVAMVAILAIVIVAIAGLGIVVVGALAESPWGTFTVGASVPIALAMGIWIHVVRKGQIREATIAGVIVLIAALVYGKHIQDSSMAHAFTFSAATITYAIAAYGFIASVLPVWLLLCPRDYLSSYLKIGTIAFLVIGVILVNPKIEAPMFAHQWFAGGGPIIKGPLFPFLFITIACGAISGFHGLVSSGTTPKMIDKETDARLIGYGAMLMEALVGITALIAATSLPVDDYLAINTDPQVSMHALVRDEGEFQQLTSKLTDNERASLHVTAHTSFAAAKETMVPLSRVLSLSNAALAAVKFHVDENATGPSMLNNADFERLGVKVRDLPDLAASTNERIAARTGGGVSLAVGMARIFAGIPLVRRFKDVLAYWYHFAIMFEALFILTTIDTGTRVGRFLMQEFLGKLYAPFGKSENIVGGVLATALVVAGWTMFLRTGTVQTIWPMFGIANQLLAVVGLTMVTTILLREKGIKLALIGFLPWAWISTTTITAGIEGVFKIYWPLAHSTDPAKAIQGLTSTVFASVLLSSVFVILIFAFRTWTSLLRSPHSASLNSA